MPQWQAGGKDSGSICTKPQFKSTSGGTFSRSAGSPAVIDLGFEQIDLTTVGPRHERVGRMTGSHLAESDAKKASARPLLKL
jgi:hypothetical protein